MAVPSRRYLVISDLHLCDVEEHPDGWKGYKSARFHFDDELAALLASFRARCAESRPILVLNGDIFDFDQVIAVPDPAPWPVSLAERQRGLDATAPKSVFKLERILEPHGRFIAALVAFLASGGEVIYVLGNHDRELCFPEVEQTLREALRRQAEADGVAASSTVDAALRIEPWFYYVPDELYVEHGHQLDTYSSFRHPLRPTVPGSDGPKLALPMGNISNRVLGTKLGYFNPHASDYILNLLRYITHWLRYYAFSRHSLVVAWLVGSLVVVSRMLRQRRLWHGLSVEGALEEAAARTGLPVEKLEALTRLQQPPIVNRFYRVVRELWLDRVALALLMVTGTVVLALVPIPLWVKLSVPLAGFPLVYLIYEEAMRGETIFTTEQHMPRVARAVAEILPTRIIAFGHTHKPRLLPLGQRVSFVDTGAWAPIFVGEGFSQLAPGLRTYLEISAGGEVGAVLGSCLGGPAANEPGRAQVE